MRNLSLLLMTSLLLFGCKAIKEAKDNKAVGRVLSSSSLTDRVYKVAIGLHPIPPQIPIYIKGKDTTIRDTTIVYNPYPVYVDSVIKCPPSKTITITTHSVDTVKTKDTSLLRLYDQSVMSNNFKDGQIIELRNQNTQLEKQSNKKTWWIVGIGVGALLIITGLLVIIFKK